MVMLLFQFFLKFWLFVSFSQNFLLKWLQNVVLTEYQLSFGYWLDDDDAED